MSKDEMKGIGLVGVGLGVFLGAFIHLALGPYTLMVGLMIAFGGLWVFSEGRATRLTRLLGIQQNLNARGRAHK